MELVLKEIGDKNLWESFLLDISEKTFLQSWNWGEFQKRMGHKINRLGFFEKEEIFALALVSQITAKRGRFFLIQHGPTVKEERVKKDVLEKLIFYLKERAEKEKISFLRMNPLWLKEDEKLFQEMNFLPSPIHASAYESTVRLAIRASEEELLKNMRKTTRYLIRQAQKNNDLKIIKSQNLNDVAVFDNLSKIVANHQRFVPFSFDFVKNEFDIFLKENQALLFFGKHQEKIVAGALIIFWSNIAFYHQAALDPSFHKIPISYLLIWEAIQEAKKRNCLFFDFWGFVDPQKYPKHPWAGPSLFKLGFGGKVFEYIKTQDFPFNKAYRLTRFFEKIRKIKRGL